MTNTQTTHEDSPTLHRLKGILEKEFGIEKSKVVPEGKFADDYDLDSLDRVELLMMCEEEFNTEISDDDAEKLITVNDVITYIDEKEKVEC